MDLVQFGVPSQQVVPPCAYAAAPLPGFVNGDGVPFALQSEGLEGMQDDLGAGMARCRLVQQDS